MNGSGPAGRPGLAVTPGARGPGGRRLLVIGGGVAGSSVAYFAARAGWTVTVLDAGSGRASDVPTALLNPVRGQSGRVDARALEGLRLSWSLIRQLSVQGHQIPHEQRGVLRPLGTDAARTRFECHLPTELPHRWLTATETLSHDWSAHDWLAPGWPHLLFLPEGGWVSGPALVAALLAESGATLHRVRAQTWNAHSATLEGSEVLTAEAVVWCGGSVGMSWGGASWGGGSGQNGAGTATQTFTHRGGSLLLLAQAPAPIPVSAGVYLAQHETPDGRRGGVLGATFEAPSGQHAASGPPLKSLHWLLSRAAALSGDLSATVTGLWTGSRLSGECSGRQSGGWWALTGLGSKGFLLGPLMARELVRELEHPRAETGDGG